MHSAMKVAALVGVAVGVVACGGGGSSTSSSGSTCTPGTTSSITLRSTGASPRNACILPGGTITFVNDSGAQRQIESTDVCPTLNTGTIAAGASASVMLTTAAQCPYHDATNPGDTSFQGIVAVTSGTVGGGGY